MWPRAHAGVASVVLSAASPQGVAALWAPSAQQSMWPCMCEHARAGHRSCVVGRAGQQPVAARSACGRVLSSLYCSDGGVSGGPRSHGNITSVCQHFPVLLCVCPGMVPGQLLGPANTGLGNPAPRRGSRGEGDLPGLGCPDPSLRHLPLF